MQPPPPEGPYSKPPTQYAPYYRAPTGYQGSPDELEALGKGYFGLSWVFAAGIALSLVLTIGAVALAQSVDGSDGVTNWAAIGAGLLTGTLIALISIKPVGRIAAGMRWPRSYEVLWCLGLGILSWCCCGLVGPAILQSIAAQRMKLFGVRTGFMGVRKRDIEAAVAELRAAQGMPASQLVAPPIASQALPLDRATDCSLEKKPSTESREE